PIGHLEQRRRTAGHHATDETQRERIRVAANRGPELLRDATGDLAQRQRFAVAHVPPIVVDVSGKWVAREARVARYPSLARAMWRRRELTKDWQVGAIQLGEIIARPRHDLANDADDD